MGVSSIQSEKFSRKFSKQKELREELQILENKLKLYKQNLKCLENKDYLKCKLRLEEIYEIKGNCVKLNYFFLEKKLFRKNQIRKSIIEKKELTEQNKINNNIFIFYQNLFSQQTGFKQNDLLNYLYKINLPMLSNGQKQICDSIITEKEIYGAPKSIKNSKTLDNDGLSKEFYELF